LMLVIDGNKMKTIITSVNNKVAGEGLLN